MFETALANTTVTVETSLLPAFTVRGTDLGGEQSALTKLLRPRITVRNGQTVLYRAAPAGDPDRLPLGPLLALGALGLVLYLATR